MVDLLMRKFSEYLVLKRINLLLKPYATESSIQLIDSCCAYMSLNCDLKKFTINQEEELEEAVAPILDTSTCGNIKKVVKT